MGNEEGNMGKVIDDMFSKEGIMDKNTIDKNEMFDIFDGICDNIVDALMPMRVMGFGINEMAKLCAIAATKVTRMDPDKWVKELKEKAKQ